MSVYINNKKVIPGPFARISKEVQRSEDGTPRSHNYSISLKGKLLAYAGSPDSHGAFWTSSGYPPDENIPDTSRLAAIRDKQGALMNQFSIENSVLEIQPFDGSAPIKAIVKLKSMTFEEGNWYQYCDYNIDLEVLRLWFGNTEVVPNGNFTIPEESWSIESSDDKGKTYRIQHTVSASARGQYDTNGVLVLPGWKIARNIVLGAGSGPSYLGLDPQVYEAPSAVNVGGMGAYNYTRGQQIDEAGGKYSVTETWLAYNPSSTGGIPCLEEYNINIRKGEDGRIRVSIEGNLQGLEVRDNITYTLTTGKHDNALARWAQLEPLLIGIATANAGGNTLNPNPTNRTVGMNPGNGTINFTLEYDNRPIIWAGALSATVQVTDKNPNDVFASLVVLGKWDGPVLQGVGTVTAKERAVAIEIVLPAQTMDYLPVPPNTDALVLSFYPGGFKSGDEASWSAQNGRYSRQVRWTWV